MSSRKKVTDLNSATVLSNEDVVHVVDVSDTTQDSAGSSKKVTLQKIKEFAQEGVQTSTSWGDIDGNIADQTDLQNALGAKINTSEKGAINGVATLGGDGKIPSSQIPPVAITNTFVVNSQVAMLALNAEEGDVAVRTDLNKTFILKTAGATVLANWQEMLTPTDTVISVNGQAGAVVLTTTNIAEGSNQYFTNGRAISALTGQNISIFTNNAGYITNANGQYVNNTANSTLSRVGSGPYTLGVNLANNNEWTGTITSRKDALGVNSGDGIVLDNQTNATASVLQASPRRRMRGRGFNSSSSTSYPIDFADHVIGSVNITPYGKYRMMRSSDNGSSWQEAFSYSTEPTGDGFKITTPQAQSNGQPGTTRVVTLENSGQNSYVDFSFSGVRKGAIGVSSSGEINLHTTGSNGVIIWVGNTLGSQSAAHYLYPNGILISGNGSFSGRVSAGANTVNPVHVLQSNGRMGHRGRLVKANLTLNVNDHIIYVDTTTSAQCIGTPTYSCASNTNQSACLANNAHGGCAWSGGSCSEYNGNESGCTSQSGCTWDTTSCNPISDETSCNNTSGCSWSSTPNDCGAIGDEGSCTGTSGCSWSPESMSDCSAFNNNEGGCTGTSGCSWSPTFDIDCTISYFDESSCNAVSGCSWDGMLCNGMGFGGNGSCSGMYVSSSAYCYGTYYTYSCNGSYATGNCSGSYGNCFGTSSCTPLNNAQCGSESGCTWATGQTTSLPELTANMEGDIGPDYIIKKVGGSGNVTIQAYAGDNIDGASSKTITTNYTGYRLHGFVYREDCAGMNESSCNSTSGCTWNTPCSGYSYDQTTCESNGCTWDSGGNYCYGSAGSYCSGTYTSQKRWHIVGVF